MKAPTNIEAIDTSWRWVAEAPIELDEDGIYLGPRHSLSSDEGARHRTYQPLKENTALFLEFAQTQPTKSRILAFANQYGLLGIAEIGDYPGPALVTERMDDWKWSIKLVRNAVNLWHALEAGPKSPITAWNKYWRGASAREVLRAIYDDVPGDQALSPDEAVQYGRQKLLNVLNDSLRKYPAQARLASTRNGDFQLTFVPTSLIGAMWLQFAQAVAHNYTIKICKGCGKPFQTGAGTNRRADAKTCNDSCRQRAYRKENEHGTQETRS